MRETGRSFVSLTDRNAVQ